MRACPAMKLLSACCGGFLMSGSFVDALKKIYDYRTGDDFGSGTNCVNAEGSKTRYMQVEAFDYNKTPWLKVTWTQISDECGGSDFTPYSATMEYNGNEEGDVSDNRLQMDMYICGPWGNYELEIVVKSSNGGAAMEKVAWEIEYGPDEYHIWDTLNTPFFDNANGALPSDNPYAPIPNDYTSGAGTTYKWPLPGSQGYYSLMYTGPFPPLECPDLHPEGVAYVGCYTSNQPGWTTADGPTGSANNADPAENYRMFDGLGPGDDGVEENGVMTLEKCAGICNGYSYFGLGSAIKCVCGNSISGSDNPNCGLEDSDEIDEYKFLCSGDSRVLCGTDDHVSVYSNEGGVPPPAPTPPPSGEYEYLGCSEDNVPRGTRIMSFGAYVATPMSAEICEAYCYRADDDFAYFGTQYRSECWCSYSLADSVELDHDGCNYECAGQTDGEICGGRNAMSVYEIGDDGNDDGGSTCSDGTPGIDGAGVCCPVACGGCGGSGCGRLGGGPGAGLGSAFCCSGRIKDSEVYCGGGNSAPCITGSPTEDYTGLGCYVDLRDGDRVMDVKLDTDSSTTMSAQICYEMCTAENLAYTYFGVQYNYECWCSMTLSESETKDGAMCDRPCTNNPGETCGGKDAIEAYKIN